MPWKKGQSGNPNGRPKTGVAFMDQLKQAVKDVEEKKKRKIFNHFVRRAFNDDTVLVALMRKLVPDTKHIEGTIGASESVMSIVTQFLNERSKKAS